MKSRGIKVLLYAATFLLIIVVVKIFVVDLYYVPTSSMENTISANSSLWVLKYSYGAHLPKSTHHIPVLSKVFEPFHRIQLWNNSRMPALQDIKRGHICLAEFNGDVKLIKRIVGLPGDTIQILNGSAFVNGSPELDINSYLLTYTATLDRLKIDSLKEFAIVSLTSPGSYEITFEGRHLRKFLTANSEIKLKALSNPIDSTTDKGIFPKAQRKKWDSNNWGKIVVPFKGFKISISNDDYLSYIETMETYEGLVFSRDADSTVLIDGVKTDHYIFKNDYYFLMGDNRMKSIDSRYLGFFPYKSILGKVKNL